MLESSLALPSAQVTRRVRQVVVFLHDGLPKTMISVTLFFPQCNHPQQRAIHAHHISLLRPRVVDIQFDRIFQLLPLVLCTSTA